MYRILEALTGVGEIHDEAGVIAKVRYHLLVQEDLPPAEPPADAEPGPTSVKTGEFVVLSGRMPQRPHKTLMLISEEGQKFPVAILAADRVTGRHKVAAPASLEATG